MKYEIQDNVWPTMMKQAAQPIRMWRQIVLCSIFGLLLLLVILGCTLGPSPLVVVALFAAVALVVLVVLRPLLAVLLVFFSAGLPSLVLPLPGHNMHLVEPALLLCLLVIILRRPNLRLRLPHLLALLFVAIAIVSFIHVPEISQGAGVPGADKRLVELIMMFLAFFCGTLLLKYVKDASSFLVGVLLTNLPLYLIGLAQALGLSVPSLLVDPGYVQDAKQSLGRLWGPFAWPSSFGMYLVNLFAIALACWLLGTCKRDRTLGAIMTLATALEIVGSGTISAASGAIILVIVAFTLTRHFKTLLATVALAGGMVALFFNKILPHFAHDDSSSRLFLWQEAIKLIVTHPWIGIGLQQFYKYYAQLNVGLVHLGPQSAHPHEQYLEWGVESGIPWLIVGILLLLSITFYCWRAYRLAPREQQVFLMAVILLVLAKIFVGFFDLTFDGEEECIFFLLAGLALGYAEHVCWGVPEHKTAAYGRSLESRAISATGMGNGLYWPLPRRPRVNPATPLQPLQPSPSINPVSSSADAAPDMQKTGRTVIIQLLSWGIALPIIFPMTALLARYLGPTQYGEYNFTLSFLAILVLLSGYGIDPLIIRELSRKPRVEWSQTLSYATGSRLLATALSVGAAVLIAIVLPVSAEQRNLLLLGSVSLFFSFSATGFRAIFECGFRTEQRVGMISLIQTTDRIVTAGLLGLIVLFHLPLLWACFLIIYSDLPFFFIQVLIARRRYGMQVRISLARAREHFLGSLPLMGYNVLALIATQADLFLLMLLVGPHSVGLYALASRITDPLLSIALAYALGVYPLMCVKFKEGREPFAMICHESTRILALAIVPLTIFVSVKANAIVTLLGGQHFEAAVIAVQLLMCTMAATFFNQLAARACTAAHMERPMLYITFASSGINILANLALIPYWQIVGAGVAALVSELIGLSLFAVLLRRRIRLFPIISVVLSVFLGNLPMLLFLIWQQQAPLLLTAPVALVLTIVGCLVTRTLSWKDVHLMRHILDTRRDKEASKDSSDQPTAILPRIEAIADWPTVILPQVRI